MKAFYWLLFVVVLTACNILAPAVAELEKVQDMDRAARAAHVPQCRIHTQGCAQVYLMIGDACLLEAQQRLGQSNAADPAACASARFGRLRDAGIPGTTLRGLEAERLVRETSMGSAAGAANRTLADRAAGVTDPQAGYYRASTVAWSASFGTIPGCAELRQAVAEASAAAAAPPLEGLDNRAAARSLQTRLTERADGRGCSA